MKESSKAYLINLDVYFLWGLARFGHKWILSWNVLHPAVLSNFHRYFVNLNSEMSCRGISPSRCCLLI